MTNDRPVECRTDNRELAERVGEIEKKLVQLIDGAANRNEKLDELVNIMGSGKLAIRFLFWLGSGVVFLITAWDWMAAHLPRQ